MQSSERFRNFLLTILQLSYGVPSVGYGFRTDEEDKHVAHFHLPTTGRLIFELGRKALLVEEYTLPLRRLHRVEVLAMLRCCFALEMGSFSERRLIEATGGFTSTRSELEEML